MYRFEVLFRVCWRTIGHNTLSRFAILVPLTILVGGCPSTPTGNLTLGIVLERSLSRVNDTIKQAGNSGRTVTIEAAAQATAAINHLKAAYLDSLDTSLDRVDQTAMLQLAQIETIVTKIETGIAVELEDAIGQAQQVVNGFPLASVTPQVRSQSPKLFAVVENGNTTLLVKGNYPGIASLAKPTLRIRDTILQPIGSTTQELTFQVPHDLLERPASGQIGVITSELAISYEVGPFWPFTRNKIASFNLPLATLPSSPGDIQFVPINLERRTETKPESSQDMVEDDNGRNTRCGNPIPAGWTVVPGSAKHVVIDEHGNRKYHDWDEHGLVTTAPAVCWAIDTSGGGRITFRLEYKIVREYWEEINGVAETIDMEWSQSVARPIPASGKWKIIFQQSGGTRQEYVAPGSSDPPYLTVGVAGENVTLKVSPPPSIP